MVCRFRTLPYHYAMFDALCLHERHALYICIYTQPPDLCDFQSASYIISFISGNKSWSREPVPLNSTSYGQQVKEDIETGFVLNTNYTVTVTLIMEHANLSSSDDFSKFTSTTISNNTNEFFRLWIRL